MILNLYNKYFKIVFVLFIILLYIIVCVNNPNKDFDIFIGATKLVLEGKTCYNVWLHSGSSGLKYFYSPLFAVLLFPLTFVSQLTYHSVWFFLNLFLLLRIFKLFAIFLPLQSWTEKKRAIFQLLCLLSVSRFLFDNLQLGQMTLFLVWGSLESFNCIQQKKIYLGAIILALIINIKIIPIALLILLLYKAEFKAAITTVFFLILSLFLPILFLGNTFNQLLLNDWWQTLSNTNNNSILDDYGRQSLSSFIPALLMDTPIQFNLKRNILQLGENEVKLILNATRLLFLALIAIMLGKPFQKFKGSVEAFYSLALICLFTPLIFPHQGKYSFFYLLPAFVLVIYYLMSQYQNMDKLFRTKENKIIVCLLIVSFSLVTLTTDGLIGRYLSDLCEYFNFITLGTFVLIIGMFSIKGRFKPQIN